MLHWMIYCQLPQPVHGNQLAAPHDIVLVRPPVVPNWLLIPDTAVNEVHDKPCASVSDQWDVFW